MKTLILVLYFLPLFASTQASNSLTLKFSMSDSRKEQGSPLVYWDTIQFYQDSHLTNQIIPRNNHYKWPVVIKDFKRGTYTVVYKDLYRKKVSKIITISDVTNEYELRLYWDKLSAYPINSLSELQNGDTIKIIFSSLGCFNFDNEVLIIKKQDDSFIAKWTDGVKTKSLILDQSSVDAFKRFENEIREIKDSYGCTTVDTYIVIGKNWIIERKDGGCAWDGFYYLKKAIFDKME